MCVCVYDRLKIEYRELAVRTFAGDNRSKPFTYTRTRVFDNNNINNNNNNNNINTRQRR